MAVMMLWAGGEGKAGACLPAPAGTHNPRRLTVATIHSPPHPRLRTTSTQRVHLNITLPFPSLPFPSIPAFPPIPFQPFLPFIFLPPSPSLPSPAFQFPSLRPLPCPSHPYPPFSQHPFLPFPPLPPSPTPSSLTLNESVSAPLLSLCTIRMEAASLRPKVQSNSKTGSTATWGRGVCECACVHVKNCSGRGGDKQAGMRSHGAGAYVCRCV